MSCSAIESKFWGNFCRGVGREDLLGQHRDDLVVDFGGGDDGLRRDLQGIFHTRTLDEWIRFAVEHDVALGPALRLDEVNDDPHLRARNVVVHEDHPVVGDLLTLGNPLRVPGAVFQVRSAPQLGEHNDEILAETGYDEIAISKLRDAGVI